MNICFLSRDTEKTNGEGRYASSLIAGVRAKGHHTVSLTVYPSQGGVPIIRRGAGILWSSIVARKYFRECNVIHALDINPYGIIAMLGSLGLNKKIVITAQGTYSVAALHHMRTRALARKAGKRADTLVAISRFTRDEILKEITPKRIEVINHGVDLSKFSGTHEPTSPPFILSVGIVKRRKGYHIAIPAFAKVRERFPELRYIIVGRHDDPWYFEELQGLAKQYGVAAAIEFKKNITDEELRDLYRTAALFVLPSVNHDNHFEGFGLVFLEAAAAGLPVIGTKGNGSEDAIHDGYNGILVPQNDIEATAAAMEAVIQDDVRAKRMSGAGVEWAKAHSETRVIEQYMRLYESL